MDHGDFRFTVQSTEYRQASSSQEAAIEFLRLFVIIVVRSRDGSVRGNGGKPFEDRSGA